MIEKQILAKAVTLVQESLGIEAKRWNKWVIIVEEQQIWGWIDVLARKQIV